MAPLLSPADLKDWLRAARKHARLTVPQLAKMLDERSGEVLLWEYAGSDALPTAAQLENVARLCKADLPEIVSTLASQLPIAPGLPEVPDPQEPPEPPAPAETPLAEIDPYTLPVGDLKRWIRRARREARLTQEALSNKIGVGKITISIWESQLHATVPRGDRIARIARACGVEVADPPPEIDEGAAGTVPAPAADLFEEVRHVAEILARPRKMAGPSNRAQGARNEQLFIDYYGQGLTLQDVGTSHGLTRERVRQVLAKMINRLPGRAVPHARFDALAEACRDLHSMPVEVAEERLAQMLGTMPLKAAYTYGPNVLGRALPIAIELRQGVDYVVPRDGPDWVGAALRLCKKWIRFNGAALVSQVLLDVQEELDVRIRRDEFVHTLERLPGFAWLDATSNWFWFGPDWCSNRLLEWARRVIATAGRAVDIEMVHSGLIRLSGRYDEPGRRTVIIPPAEVLLAMLGACDDTNIKQGDDVELLDMSKVRPVDPTEVVEQVIAKMREYGGVMSLGELKTALVAHGMVNPVTLAIYLASSPVLRRLDHGIYAIRGMRLDPQHVARAFAAPHAERPSRPVSTASNVETGEGLVAWEIELTAGAIANRMTTLPAAAVPALPGGRYDVDQGDNVLVNKDAKLVHGAVRVMTRLGGQDGDRFRIHFDVANRVCGIERLAVEAGVDADADS